MTGGDGRLIEKRILHVGRQKHDVPSGGHPVGTKLSFHFTCHLPDDANATERTASTGRLLDDSRRFDNMSTADGAMELIVGKQFKMECWETCLQMMALGEVASFRIDKQLTFNYSTVARTLRDAFTPDGRAKAATSGHHQHTCGMMAMQRDGGLGYADLNELMKCPSDLVFTFELLAVTPPESYAKDTWQMDAAEKGEHVARLRVRGNELFRDGDFSGALRCYTESIALVDQLMLREKPHEPEWLDLRSTKLPLLLNHAQCLLLTKSDYPLAIDQCTEALTIDSGNVKALFRRGRAHAAAWNPVEARRDFEAVMSTASPADASLIKLCRRELAQIDVAQRERDAEDKRRLQRLF